MPRVIMRPSFLTFLFCLFIILSCGQEDQKTSKVVATVNDYIITQDQFRTSLVECSKYFGNKALSFSHKERHLGQMIDQELIIQKAIELGLDKKPKFRRAMEYFWAQTLISDLIRHKAIEISKNCLVTEMEVAEQYKAYIKGNKNPPPLKDVLNEITKQVIDKKKQEGLQNWIESLKKDAKIYINSDNLAAIK